MQLPKHWMDYQAMIAPGSLSGRNVSPTEVARYVDKEQLKLDPHYRWAIGRLLDTRSKTRPHVTPRAAAPLKALLDTNRPTFECRAKVLGTPRYSPGVGIMPANPDPNVIYGPHVSLKVLFGEAKAEPVSGCVSDALPGMVSVHGRRIQVAGTLTVFLHGKADRHSRAAPKARDVHVHAPLIARTPAWRGDDGESHKYLLVIRDGRESGNQAVLKQTVFDVGPMPMAPRPT